jgi:chorismate mutase
MTKAVRGAIQVGANVAADIEAAAVRLVREMLRANSIADNHIVSILFSVTGDLTAANPATGLRRVGFAATPLFCAQEPQTVESMARVIRVLITWNSRGRRPAVPVYLDGADALRPDLAREGGP